MKSKLKVLVAGRSKATIVELAKQLAARESIEVRLRHFVNGHADPLAEAGTAPDILVMHMQGGAGGELDALLKYPPSSRPPLVVVSEADDPALMRLAMKAGARDFLTGSTAAEVLTSIDAIQDEIPDHTSDAGRSLAVINAKGGSGATFIACNLAHLSASTAGQPTALVGLDMQFPTLPAYFDMKLKHGLLQALEAVDTLDSVAIDAMLATHKSGLKLLAARPDDFRLSFESYADRMNQLFDLLQSNYSNVVIDVPRHLDEIGAQVVSRASEIVIVVQQSLPHVQDATRLMQLMRDQLGVPAERALIAVNRYHKNSEITLDDIENAFPDSRLEAIPNRFREVSESINLGVPIYESARQSPVTRALIKLQSRLAGMSSGDRPVPSQGGLRRLQSIFGGH